MSIETQYYSQATPLFTVPRTEFSPVPDVNGLVVNFALHLPEDRAVHDAQGFLAMVSNQIRSHRFVHFSNCMEDHHTCLLTAVYLCGASLTLNSGFCFHLGSPSILHEEKDAPQLFASLLQCFSD